MKKIFLLLLICIFLINVKICKGICEDDQFRRKEVVKKYANCLETYGWCFESDILKEPPSRKFSDIDRFYYKAKNKWRMKISIDENKRISDNYYIYLLKSKSKVMPLKKNKKTRVYPKIIKVAKIKGKWVIDNTEEREEEKIVKKYANEAEEIIRKKRIKRLKKMSILELERLKKIKIMEYFLTKEFQQDSYFQNYRTNLGLPNQKEIEILKSLKGKKLRVYFVDKLKKWYRGKKYSINIGCD